MRVLVLGSGSRGNSILIEGADTRLLIDAGFSARELERRLRAVRVKPERLSAILVTHEHRDHSIGMGSFARRHRLPLYLTESTRRACADLLDGGERIHLYRPSRTLVIGALRVDPFLTAHDALDPVAVSVTEVRTGYRVGLATDLGTPTAGVVHALRGCHVLMLEANHDETMLRESPYPWSVKARIGGPHGHLSNRAAARLATELHHPSLGAVILAHLSQECNTPDLAYREVGQALAAVGYRGLLVVARQEAPLEPIDVAESLRESRGLQLSFL